MTPRKGGDLFAQSFVTGTHIVSGRHIPAVSTTLSLNDKINGCGVRWGIGRYSYQVEPGLYAVGSPTSTSPVLVTANYKLTFDALRRELTDIDGFILVLQTMGINVWCAAGEGTFGTDELVHRIRQTQLDQLVSHKQIIVPQLGASGVAAFKVKKQTSFKVLFGPIRADHIQTYLANGTHITAPMRRKEFPLYERAVLVPMELVPAMKAALPLALVLAVIGGFGGSEPYLTALGYHGVPAAASIMLAVLTGAVLTPLLLPWFPGRAFSLKGAIAALLLGFPLLLLATWSVTGATASLTLGTIGLGIIMTSASAFLAMNFTGASTYTSLSGVRKEMSIAVPLEIGAAIVGLCLWGVSLFAANPEI